MDRLRELELEVRAAEMERNAVKEMTVIAFKEFDENKRELERLFRLKEDKDGKLFVARKALLNYNLEEKK